MPHAGLVAGASVGSSGAGGGRQGHLTRDHLPLHLCPDDAHEELLLAPLSAQGQVQARSASARAQKPCLVHTTAPCAGPAARGGRRPRHPRSLGGRPDALRQPGPVAADPSRALLSVDVGAAVDQQGGGAHGPSAGPDARSRPGAVASHGDLRQRHRVRSALPTPPLGAQDLLLQYSLPLAEGRRGERHRSATPLPAPHNQHEGADLGASEDDNPSLQQHAQEVSQLPHPGGNLQ